MANGGHGLGPEQKTLFQLSRTPDGDIAPILDLPSRRFLDAATEGREAFLDETLSAAFSHASLLSIPSAVERLVPMIEAALDGDPATHADLRAASE